METSTRNDGNPFNRASVSEKTDQELAELSAENPDFFGVLMERYEAPLRRYIRRIASLREEDIDDILQETFIKTYRNINDYDHDAKFSSWIYRIAHNQTVDTLRKRRIDAASFSIEEHDAAQFLRSVIDLEEEMNQKDCFRRAERLIRELPETYRDALILRFLEEKSYEEIMDILEIPKGSVATLISRGRKILSDRLQAQGVNCH